MLAFVYLPPQMKVSNFYTSIFTLIQSIPTDHASTPPHLTAPLRLDAFTVAMSLRVMVAVKTRAKPLSVTWPHSSFELSCAAHALQALLGPTYKALQALHTHLKILKIWKGLRFQGQCEEVHRKLAAFRMKNQE